MARITIANYRCFSNDAPLQFNLEPGLTAFVGPNNAGKSAIVRFFHEFAQLFALLSSSRPTNTTIDALFEIPGGVQLGVNAISAQSVFCDWSPRDLSMKLKIEGHEYTFSYGRGSHAWHCNILERVKTSDKIAAKVSKDHILQTTPGTHPFDLKPLVSLANDLAQSIYIGPFRHILTEGGGHYDATIGTTFIAEWQSWKAGNDKHKNRVIAEVTATLAEIFGFRSLDISASMQPANTLHVVADGRSYKLQELGSGFTQFVNVLGNAVFKRPTYIFIDEPELHLHPALQMRFLLTLERLCSKGVVIATHSIGLARAVADTIYAVNKVQGEDKRVVSKLEQTPRYAQFLGEMGFFAYQALGFRKILLVEGPHDVRLWKELLRKKRSDASILVMPLGGGSGINGKCDDQLAELHRITPDIWAVVDSDRAKPTDPPKPTAQDFELSCKSSGIQMLITDRTEIENYLTDEAVKRACGPRYRALGRFEEHGKTTETSWSKRHGWRIASEMELKDFEGTDVGNFLDAVCKLA